LPAPCAEKHAEALVSDGKNYRGKRRLQVALTERTSLSIEPYFRVWSVDDSATDTIQMNGQALDVYEPRNETLEVGLGVSVTW